MEQTVTDKQICASCGVDVRPNSMFCYNCGGDVKVATPSDARVMPVEPEKAVAVSAETAKLEMPPVKEEAPPEQTKTAEKPAVIEEKKSIEDPKLKSAASMRRQSKSFQKKSVEVVWEPPQSSSLIRLVFVTLFLLLFAAVIVYLAVYNK